MNRRRPWLRQFTGRLRRPVLWVALASVYLPYAGYLGHEAWVRVPAPNVWGWAFRMVTPFLFLFGYIWAAPIPWEWAWRPGRTRFVVKGALAGLLFSNAYMAALVLFDALLKALGGVEVDLVPNLVFHVVLYAPAMMLVGGVIIYRDQSERDRERFQRQAEEAQTRLLQSQLHPHVLFNALNGLAELILKDPPHAERNVRALSDLLRKLLAASASTYLPLGVERILVDDYLALEAMRLGPRLEVAWDWDEDLEALPVIPLVLQPLVENAVKHGLAPHIEGGRLKLEARREGGDVVLGVRNTGAPLGSSSAGASAETEGGGGIGLANLRSRLDLAYGEAARFDLREESGWTVAELRLSAAALHSFDGTPAPPRGG